MWKEIKGFSKQYVNKKGEVLGISGKILKGIYDKDGYTKVSLKSDKGKIYSKRIHRLVAEAFIGNNENKPIVNHLNGIKDDNRIENLEWATVSENGLHAYREGLMEHPQNKAVKISRNGKLVGAYKNKTIATKKLNVNIATLNKHIKNKTLLYEELEIKEVIKIESFIKETDKYNNVLIDGGRTIYANSNPIKCNGKYFQSSREASVNYNMNEKTVLKYLKNGKKYKGLRFVRITPYNYLTR